jgi:uncharacterized protein
MHKILFSILFLNTSLAFCQEKGLLFEISGKNLETPSYIFGTMHLLCKGDFVFSDSIVSKIKLSEQVALEMDLDDPALSFKMLSKMKMKGDTALSDLMPENRFVALKAYLKDTLGFPPMIFSKTKPFLLYSLVITKMLPCEVMTLETEIMKLAKGKAVLGLESLDFQMDLVDKMSYINQANYLLETLDDKQKALAEFKEMADTYKERDLEKLLKLTDDGDKMMADFENEMLLKRNKTWIPEITKLINKKSTFIAVGAGHLGGKEGVLQLLRNEGFTTRAIE